MVDTRCVSDPGDWFSTVPAGSLKEHSILRRRHSSQGTPPSHRDLLAWQLLQARCARLRGSIIPWRWRTWRRSVSLSSRWVRMGVCRMSIWRSYVDTFVQIVYHNWNIEKPAAESVFFRGGADAPCAGSWRCSQENDTWRHRNRR